MADEEKAAKAARARALLKSHQKKKKAGTGITPSNSNLSPLTAGKLGDATPSVSSASALFSPPASDAGGTGDDKSELAWLGEKDKSTPALSKLSSSSIPLEQTNGVNGTTFGPPPSKQPPAREPQSPVPNSVRPKSPTKSSLSRPATPRNGIVTSSPPTRQITSPSKSRTFSPPPPTSSTSVHDNAALQGAAYEQRREEDRKAIEQQLRKQIGEEEEAKRAASERRMAADRENFQREFNKRFTESSQRHQEELQSLRARHERNVTEVEERLRREFSSQRREDDLARSTEFARRKQEDEQKWREEREVAIASAASPLQATIQNHQQTISLLVADKNNLTAELDRLEGIEQRSQNSDRLLEEGRMLVESLNSKVAELEIDLHDASSRAMTSSMNEKELSDRLQDSERELELSRRTLIDTRQQLNQSRARVKDLEEQIENDDRLEQMEKSLRTIQDRADSLELQLSKTKQALGKTKAERDAFESQINSQKDSDESWRQKHEALSQELSGTKDSLFALTKEHSTIEAECASLRAQQTKASQEIGSLHSQLGKLRGEFEDASRALQMAQSAVTASNRRADRGEEALKALQKENVQLVESLNEMRTKTVELNDDKVNLSDKIENLERGLRSRDDKIRELEGLIDHAYSRVDELVAELAGVDKIHGKQRNEAETVSREQMDFIQSLEQRKKDMEEEIQDLRGDRSRARATIDQLESEIDKAQVEKGLHSKELDALRAELAERDASDDDTEGVLARMREEVETLRAELLAKDDEHVRITSQLDEAMAKLTLISSSNDGGRSMVVSSSLSDEMMDSQRQQHELELSNARSQIRQLETAVYQEQAKTHTLQRRITTLEMELSQMNVQAESSRKTQTPSRTRATSSQEGRFSGEYGRRYIPTSHVGLSPTILSLAAKNRGLGIDAGLSPDAQHKRHVSLSMLRARIESEVKFGNLNGSEIPRVKMSKLSDVDGVESLDHRRSQFGDETHVFCCSACTGDVVVL